MADPAIVQVFVGLGGVATLTALGRWFIVRPLQQAEAREQAARDETEKWKALWKKDQEDREKRILAMETALLGTPSSRYRETQDTMSMLVESTLKQDREAELQRRMLEERAATIGRGQHSPPLAGMQPMPRPRVVREEYAPGVRPTDPAPRNYPEGITPPEPWKRR